MRRPRPEPSSRRLRANVSPLSRFKGSAGDLHLQVRDLSAGYGTTVVVDQTSLTIRAETITLLVGRNGSGKSTLLKAVFGLAQVRSGAVSLDGVDVTGRAIADRIAAGLRYVPQVGGVFKSMRVEENLELASGAADDRVDHDAIARTLELFPTLKGLLPRQAGALSGGQQRLLSFAMGVVTAPRFLLIDEPSAGLAPKLAIEVLEHLVTIRDGLGTGILLVEQNVRIACGVADAVHVLRDGRIHWSGSPTDLLAQPTLAAFL